MNAIILIADLNLMNPMMVSDLNGVATCMPVLFEFNTRRHSGTN